MGGGGEGESEGDCGGLWTVMFGIRRVSARQLSSQHSIHRIACDQEYVGKGTLIGWRGADGAAVFFGGLGRGLRGRDLQPCRGGDGGIFGARHSERLAADAAMCQGGASPATGTRTRTSAKTCTSTGICTGTTTATDRGTSSKNKK
jgi:hypothetical protein